MDETVSVTCPCCGQYFPGTGVYSTKVRIITLLKQIIKAAETGEQLTDNVCERCWKAIDAENTCDDEDVEEVAGE